MWLAVQFTMHQYRLAGPYANPKVAEEVYSRQPTGDFLECSITAAFLGASKARHLLVLFSLWKSRLHSGSANEAFLLTVTWRKPRVFLNNVTYVHPT